MALIDKLTAIGDAIRVQSGKTEKLTLDQMPEEIINLQSLGFEIVGGTVEPTNPKENTIWVNTDTEITSWTFSATQPETQMDGFVWVVTDTSDSAELEFNALKKNGVMVYPISVNQYVNGAWIEKVAKFYRGSEWVELDSSFYWVKNGKIQNSLGVYRDPDYTNSGYKFNFNEDAGYVEIAAPGSGGYTYGRSNAGVNVTDYSTLEVEVLSHTGGALTVGLLTATGNISQSSFSYKTTKSIAGADTIKCSIASATGSYYIGLHLVGSANVLIKSIRLRR